MKSVNNIEYKISKLKERIWPEEKNKLNINDPNGMNLWKINVSRGELKDVLTKEDI